MGRTFERPSWQAGAGDKSLELFEFLELLVRVALQRQNPMLGTVGHEHTVEAPLPACLDYLLAEHILKFAHRDALKGASIGFQPAPLGPPEPSARHEDGCRLLRRGGSTSYFGSSSSTTS